MGLFLAIGLMLSPRALMAAGNAAGLLGPYWYAALVGLLCWALCSWHSHRTLLASASPTTSTEAEALGNTLGPLAAGFLPLARLALCVVLATSVLALAGFAFNEVFWLSFPNMGFTFVLLAVVCGAQLLGDRVPLVLQATCASGAVLGIAVLAGVGLYLGPAVPPDPLPAAGLPMHDLAAALVPATVAFLGFELTGRDPRRHRWGLAGLLLMAALLTAFTAAMQLHVPADRLARTTLPHMSAARHILGDTGRYLAAGAAILGAAAAVNTLVISWGRWVARRVTGQALGRGISAGLPFCAVAALLGLGYAGEELLETWIAAATGMVFLGYALVAFGAWKAPGRCWAAPPAVFVSLLLAVAMFWSAIAALG